MIKPEKDQFERLLWSMIDGNNYEEFMRITKCKKKEGAAMRITSLLGKAIRKGHIKFHRTPVDK